MIVSASLVNDERRMNHDQPMNGGSFDLQFANRSTVRESAIVAASQKCARLDRSFVGGELLDRAPHTTVSRSEVEQRASRYLLARDHVGEAVAAREHDAIVLHHQHRAAGLVARQHAREVRIHRALERGRARRLVRPVDRRRRRRSACEAADAPERELHGS
jgi:hypothetical protein